MQVYANQLAIEGPDSRHTCLRAIHGWLRSLLQQDFSIEDICRNNEEFRGGEVNAWLRCYACIDSEVNSYAWRIKHRDRDVKGRQWVVDLALEGSEAEIKFYCSLEVDDMSTLIKDPVVASRPRVITYLKRNVEDAEGLSFKDAPGSALKSVNEDRSEYIALASEIERESRDFPLVLMTPSFEGRYLCPPERLQESLFGLAQVVIAQGDYDHYDLQATLGRRFSSRRGEACIVGTMKADNTFSVAKIAADTIDAQAQIIAAVTHRTNVPKLRRMLRPENVVTKSLHQRMKAARAARADEAHAAIARQEMDELWQQLLDQSEQEKSSLQSGYDNASFNLMQVEDDLQKSRDENRALRYSNNALKAGSKSQDKNAGTNYGTFLNLLRTNSKPSPRECLELIELALPDTCVILSSAFDSADEVEHFEHGGRLLDMLIRLLTDYSEVLKSGKGDSEARKVFTPKEFSATESDSVTKSSLKEKRKFKYGNEEIYMYSHLKVGVSDNEQQTIRVHFDWRDDKIIIGHCGLHLPL
ncbi:hypothetical protein [Pseudoxanthomonas winnipegensis]|uniref:hypothetical protein n=1 Tax=Pseudoxanthomonas winnipegensis TaxID=2480810 RepID=UPI003F86C636